MAQSMDNFLNPLVDSSHSWSMHVCAGHVKKIQVCHSDEAAIGVERYANGFIIFFDYGDVLVPAEPRAVSGSCR
jgi:hypothetical protein